MLASMVKVSWNQDIYEIQYYNQLSKDVSAFLSTSLHSKRTDAYPDSFSFWAQTFQLFKSKKASESQDTPYWKKYIFEFLEIFNFFFL